MLSCYRGYVLRCYRVVVLLCLQTKRTLDEIAAEYSTKDEPENVGDSLEQYRHRLSKVRACFTLRYVRGNAE